MLDCDRPAFIKGLCRQDMQEFDQRTQAVMAEDRAPRYVAALIVVLEMRAEGRMAP